MEDARVAAWSPGSRLCRLRGGASRGSAIDGAMPMQSPAGRGRRLGHHRRLADPVRRACRPPVRRCSTAGADRASAAGRQATLAASLRAAPIGKVGHAARCADPPLQPRAGSAAAPAGCAPALLRRPSWAPGSTTARRDQQGPRRPPEMARSSAGSTKPMWNDWI